MKNEEKKKICETMIYLMDPYRIEAMKRYFPEIGKNRELTEKSCELADQVEALELSDGQKQTIDRLMVTMENLHDTQLSIIYAAGIIDGLIFIKERGLLDKVFQCM